MLNILEILFIALGFDIAVISVSMQSTVLCPSFCVCDTWYELQRVSCVGRHLYSIHTSASSNVQAFDLSNNSISVLYNYELVNAGLSRLKYLNLSTNVISEIGLNAFDGLSELTILDLSRNHLYYLLSDTFTSVRRLRILHLSKNNFNSDVPKLECPWLTDLSLDSCQISHIPVDTFIGLSQIRTLDLSNNLMIQLDFSVLQPLQSLRKLSIERNLWSCNKVTYDLQIYLTRRNIEYRTVCTKMLGQKKSEKIILYNPQIINRKHQPSMTSGININKDVILTRKSFTTVSTYKNTTTHVVNATDEANVTTTLNTLSPYWFFIMGFLLGSACSIFTCYIWLTKSSVPSCCRESRGRTADDTQRISLLQNLWQYEDPTLNECPNRTIFCPDTPPPPYREVMLGPRLYHSPSVVTNLNRIPAASNTEYT